MNGFVKTCLICLIFVITGCAEKEILYHAAPSVLPNTQRLMKTPGYWIGRLQTPDKVILTPAQIDQFNQKFSPKQPAMEFSGTDLKNQLSAELDKFRVRKLYQKNTRPAGSQFYSPIYINMALDKIPDRGVGRHGLITHFADQRLLPTDDPLYALPGDIDFDEVQNSGLDLGTPVVVYHISRDGKWAYTETSISNGWVKTDNIAFPAPKAHQKCTDLRHFAVVTRAKAEIYLNPDLTSFYDYVRMGARLPLTSKLSTGVYQVTIPVRNSDGVCVTKSAYVRAEDAHDGFLPYTPRTTIEQAFEFFNSSYGWGDMQGEQDCSRFIQSIFATVGIVLPRNSSQQAEIGQLLGEFPKGTPDEAKLSVLSEKGVGGITILRLDNHIMLYLGMVDGRPYAIHATWGYHQMIGGRDVVRLVNRVAVTDMSLGAGSVKGSLLQRLIKIRKISN